MYFIRDCNGKVVGNPKGYPTFKGAMRQQQMAGSKAYNAIWKAFHQRTDLECRCVSTIKWEA